MKLFRKHLTPEELGAMIYENLRAQLASDGPLSIGSLLTSIGREEESLPDQHQGAIMVGTMFGAIIAVDRSTSHWVAERIAEGMRREFVNHLREQGASDPQVRDWEGIIRSQVEAYRAVIEGYDENLEPPWKLGRHFYWNIVGNEEYFAGPIKEATLFLLAARDAAQSLLNKYGPSLLLD